MSWDVLLTAGRRMGKTTAICKAAKEIGATVITHSEQEARRLREEFGISAVNCLNPERLRGTDRPFLMDPTTAGALLVEKDRKIADLESCLKESQKLCDTRLSAFQRLGDRCLKAEDERFAAVHEKELLQQDLQDADNEIAELRQKLRALRRTQCPS